jgi:hypothetical protein
MAGPLSPLVPAKAGIHPAWRARLHPSEPMGPRLRGDERGMS